MVGGVQAYAWLPTSSIVYGNYNLANTFGAEQLETEYNQNFNLKSYTDLGFTFTHEVAHNLSLYHVFQGNSCEPEQYPLIQGDKIEDTPPQTQGGGCYGACGFISYNVMDYLTQTCKNRITQGQVERVESAMGHKLNARLPCMSISTMRQIPRYKLRRLHQPLRHLPSQPIIRKPSRRT